MSDGTETHLFILSSNSTICFLELCLCVEASNEDRETQNEQVPRSYSLHTHAHNPSSHQRQNVFEKHTEKNSSPSLDDSGISVFCVIANSCDTLHCSESLFFHLRF
jgi:hypothetical protein